MPCGRRAWQVSAYTFFALALSVAAGAIACHVVGAMFATEAIFAAVRLAVAQLRPSFLPPLNYLDQQTCTLGKCQAPKDLNWTAMVVQTIPGQVLYLPGDRFWVFQGIEAAIFVGLALAQVALTL